MMMMILIIIIIFIIVMVFWDVYMAQAGRNKRKSIFRKKKDFNLTFRTTYIFLSNKRLNNNRNLYVQ